MNFLDELGLEELWRHILSKIGGKVDKSDYAPVDKTDSMTLPVGKSADGKLWTAPSGAADAVLYTVQSLTDAQQAQARENITAADAAEVVALDREVNGYSVDVPAKYYRVLFNSVWNSKNNAQSLSASLSELRFYGADGMECSVESVVADSEYATDYAAGNVLDGDLKTFWSSANADGVVHTLSFVLSQAAIATKIGIVLRPDMECGLIDAMTVQASADGAAWTDVLHVEGIKGGWAASTWRYFDLASLQRQISSVRQLAEGAQREIEGVKYAPIVQDGAWDYLNLPATDGAKVITYVEDADSPFAASPRYALAGQNFFPDTQKFNRTSPYNGISFEMVGRVMHISGTATSSDSSFFLMNGDSLDFPLPEHVHSGDTIVLRTISTGTTLSMIMLQMSIRDENGTQLLAKNFDFSSRNDMSTSFTIPDGATKFRLNYKITSADSTQTHDRYIVAAMYKADEAVYADSTLVDGSTTSLSLFPVPAERLDFDVTMRDYVDIRVGADAGDSLTSESLGYLMPEMYGALGDDYTDDAVALQACIDDGIAKKLPVRGMRRYMTSAPMMISGTNADVEIQALRYTGTDAAIVMDCDSSRLVVRKLNSGGVGLCLSGQTVRVRYNAVELGDMQAASHGILLESPAKEIYQNHIRFRQISAGGEGYNCIMQRLDNAGEGTFITEQTFEGGQCRNADWAYYGHGGNNKFYNFQVEGSISGGYCFIDRANALVIGDRHAESMRDGLNPYIKIISTNDGKISSGGVGGMSALRYISAVALRVNEIDVSGAPTTIVYNNGATNPLNSVLSMGKIDCQIDYYIQPGGAEKNFNTFAQGALIWGNVLIFQNVPYQHWQVTENLDLRTINEDTPSMPCVFEIACANCEIHLHPSYCYLGINHFEVIQTEEYTAKIYDYYSGNCIFDGSTLGAGTFEVTTWTSGRVVWFDGQGMEWGVQKIPSIDDRELPTVTTEDTGKFLRVSSTGEWTAESITNAAGVNF